MVGVARFELATPAMSMQCSTAELYAHSVAAPNETLPHIQVSNWAKLILLASNLAAGTFLGKHALNFQHEVLQMKRLGKDFGVGH